MHGYDFKLGSDPEAFIWDTVGREFVGAHGLLEGTKSDPYHMGQGFYCQVDGMAAEFNTPVYPYEDELKHGIRQGLHLVNRQLDKVEKGRFKAMFIDYAFFTQAEIDRQPRSSFILGCDPDYNAITLGKNPTPELPDFFRTAGVHIHVSWTQGMDVNDPGHFLAGACLTRAYHLSMYGPPKLRQAFYGAPYSFRPKSYGVELRSTGSSYINGRQAHDLQTLIGHAFYLKGSIVSRAPTPEFITNVNNGLEYCIYKQQMRLLKLHREELRGYYTRAVAATNRMYDSSSDDKYITQATEEDMGEAA